jgi:hypothetical protein
MLREKTMKGKFIAIFILLSMIGTGPFAAAVAQDTPHEKFLYVGAVD